MIYRSKSGGVKRWAKMLTTAVLAFVLAIVVFASTAFAGLLNEYNVDIVVDGVTTTVTTREEKPTEILTNANITLESTDKLDLSGFEAGKGGKAIAPIGIGRIAKIIGKQLQLAVARGGQDEAVEQCGEGAHQSPSSS